MLFQLKKLPEIINLTRFLKSFWILYIDQIIVYNAFYSKLTFYIIKDRCQMHALKVFRIASVATATQIILATLPLYSQNATWQSSTANTAPMICLKNHFSLKQGHLFSMAHYSIFFIFFIVYCIKWPFVERHDIAEILLKLALNINQWINLL